MIARAGSGWQTVLADLSLILFMVTAAAVGDEPSALPAPAPAVALPALAEPVAVWRGGPSAPPLDRWLAQQGGEDRLRLTIVAPAPAGAAALDLARSAGRPARVVIEPVPAGTVAAFLTFDVHPPVPKQGAPR